jgi:hypothetical protein
MSEGLHLPHGHGHGHGKVPTWAWWLAGALVIYLLLRRGSNSVADMVVPGGGQSQALRSDVNPRQAAAEELQLGQLKKEFAFQDAINALELKSRQAQGQAIDDYSNLSHSLYTGQSYASGIKCPSGKPRIDPTTGRVYCREKVGGGYKIGNFINDALTVFSAYQGGFFSGKPAAGTPGINPNASRAKPLGGGVSVARGGQAQGYAGVVSPASVLWCDPGDC